MNKLDDGFEPGPGEDRSFVTALARGLDVLRCFRPDETTLTNQEIAARTHLPKPTVTRLTYTLRKLGYLVQSERDGTYRLGAGVLTLGYGVLAGMEIAERAREEMRRICEGPNPYVTAALGERYRLQVIYSAVQRSTQAVSLTMNVGARLPLFHSSIGRAVLVAMTPAERAHMTALAIEDRPDEADRVRRSVAAAEESWDRHGFTTSFGDWKAEINGIAIPIRSLDGDRVHAINVGAPSFLASPEQLIGDYGPRLLAAGRALGNPGPAA